jgi:aminoglycoside 3'-phosphotransferase I
VSQTSNDDYSEAHLIALVPKPISVMSKGYRWTRDAVGQAGAAVWRLHGKENAPDLFLKYGKGSIAGDINNEHARLKWLAGRTPVPTVLEFYQTPGQSWMLTTAVISKSAMQLLEESPASGFAVVNALAAFLKQFHSIPVAECPFDRGYTLRLIQARQRIDADLIDPDDFDDERQGWTAEQVWEAIKQHLPFQSEPTVTHGDFSLDNVFLSDGKVIGCIDVGRAGVADRYQDIAIAWNAVGALGLHLRDQLLRAYGIGQPDNHRLQFHMMLDELF